MDKLIVFIDNFRSYLSKDRIAICILGFMIVVLILNAVKECIVLVYKKQESKNHKCRYLREGNDGLSCTHRSYLKRFSKTNGSCDRCFGRTMEVSKEDIEERASKSYRLVYVMFLLARAGKSLLPYVAIIFTLLSAMSLSTTTAS